MADKNEKDVVPNDQEDYTNDSNLESKLDKKSWIEENSESINLVISSLTFLFLVLNFIFVNMEQVKISKESQKINQTNKDLNKKNQEMNKENQKMNKQLLPLEYHYEFEPYENYVYSTEENKNKIAQIQSVNIIVDKGVIGKTIALDYRLGEIIHYDRLDSVKVGSNKKFTDMNGVSASFHFGMPGELLLTDDKKTKIYDYTFCFIESINGEQRLDMLCADVDLNLGEVKKKVYTETDLLLSEANKSNESEYRKQQFEDYMRLRSYFKEKQILR